MTFVIILFYYGIPYIKSEFKDEFNFEPNNEPRKRESIDEYSDDALEKMR
ncbi:hypothetical protein NsoK4_08140 [Nitrosopumilus sp. K4]|nr:hypothetical protein [Nitrosopumilus sp. K4]QUC64385.1 hypothetical protein NsoK4_08140 [Nitrosopumilus sp. K4]